MMMQQRVYDSAQHILGFAQPYLLALRVGRWSLDSMHYGGRWRLGLEV